MNKQISALIDDDIALEEVSHLISDPQVIEAWNQYHLIGDVMRGAPSLRSDFKSDFMQKLESEVTILVPNVGLEGHSTHGSSMHFFSVWPIAASIVAVGVLGWIMLQLPAQEAPPIALVPEIPTEYLAMHQAVAASPSAHYSQVVGDAR